MSLDPVLALTKMVAERLLASPEFTDLCPPERFVDSYSKPDARPLVQIGNGDWTPPDHYETWHHKVFLDLDVWTRGEDNAVLCRQITGAIARTLSGATWAPWRGDGWIVHGLGVSVTSDRDTSEQDLSHATVALDAIMQEVATNA
ncbi:MAG: DUF3168 domain-containing protein [Rhizobiales bacterium]|nr:DUF3168 domain-containing protein [Hyphomicrobiales bacterium]